METYVLYLYRSIMKSFPNDDSLLPLGSRNQLVAVIQNKLKGKTRRQQITEFQLQPFEIIQSNYDYILYNAKKLNLKILAVDFDIFVDLDVKDELINSVNSNEYEKAKSILYEIRKETDIKSVSFIFNDRIFRISKYGVVEIDGEYNELQNLTLNSPVALITGIKNSV